MTPERRITRSRTAAQRPIPILRPPSPSPSCSPTPAPLIILDVLKPDSLPSSRESSPDPNSDDDSDVSSSLSALSSAAAQSESDSPAPTPAAILATTTTQALNSVKADTHTKKKRRTSPPPPTTNQTAAPALVRATSTPKVPTTTAAASGKSKAPRVSTVGATAPTRAQKALLVRESNSTSRAGSQHVVEDDTPLPLPPSRTGMGEGAFPTPKESYLRQENYFLRKEAEYIIHQAEVHKKELNKRKDRDERNGTTLVEGKRNRKSINYNEDEDEDGDVDLSNHEDEDGDDSEGGPGPSTSIARLKRRQSQLNGNRNGNGHGSSSNERRRSSTTNMKFPEPVKDQSFEGQFNQLQKEHKANILAEKAAEQSRPPIFPKNARPTVVLANGTVNGIGGKTVPRDKTERTYQEGLSGLSNEMEIDAQGFVDNVKENLRAILKYYFPERSPRRDAFCERIGRGLAQLGWELTDNADAALLP
ncbi:hypothetical protein I203_100608 [Kwoniella mangroviensis CBS 8507]|uniref:uncharacterized protein n=1 Tax=Kwoniella mangroviensis CBS 8507 TaxID=1296122 RepID=UPI00080CD016|nr:uncharacterized protein I203_07182 [Kwoniella mangroviensis CBS 8507]OCF63861.1 hypothetical protein I203_07182 [Kwoniella mangroviensis CBS 8507]